MLGRLRCSIRGIWKRPESTFTFYMAKLSQHCHICMKYHEIECHELKWDKIKLFLKHLLGTERSSACGNYGWPWSKLIMSPLPVKEYTVFLYHKWHILKSWKSIYFINEKHRENPNKTSKNNCKRIHWVPFQFWLTTNQVVQKRWLHSMGLSFQYNRLYWPLCSKIPLKRKWFEQTCGQKCSRSNPLATQVLW